jgi:hypothetical protein
MYSQCKACRNPDYKCDCVGVYKPIYFDLGINKNNYDHSRRITGETLYYEKLQLSTAKPSEAKKYLRLVLPSPTVDPIDRPSQPLLYGT